MVLVVTPAMLERMTKVSLALTAVCGQRPKFPTFASALLAASMALVHYLLDALRLMGPAD